MSYVEVSGLGYYGATPAAPPVTKADVDAIKASNQRLLDQYNAAEDAYNRAVQQKQAIVALIAKEQTAYQNAERTYANQVQAVNAANASSQASYAAIHAHWQAASQAYQNAVSARNGVAAGYAAASASVFRATGGAVPPDYAQFQTQGNCYTAAQRAAHAVACNIANAGTVKGLGSTSLDCQWQNLPVCNYPALPPNPGPEPQPPPTQTFSGAPPAPPPNRVVPPDPVPPTPPVLEPVPTVTSSLGTFSVGGLLALVLVGGGAAYYFSTRKKKAAA